MTTSIDHSKKVLQDIGKLASDIIALAKHGIGIGSISSMFDLMSDGKSLITDASQALPELKSMDSEEASALAGAAYDMVKAIIGALA